jgi:hypothetical protein
VYDATIAAGASGAVKLTGIMSGFTGLTPGADYYLDPSTAGGITSTSPTLLSGAQALTRVGFALTSTTLYIATVSPIQL